MSTHDRLAAIRARRESAFQALVEACQRGYIRMTIPVDEERDHDRRISNALRDIDWLLDEVARLRDELAEVFDYAQREAALLASLNCLIDEMEGRARDFRADAGEAHEMQNHPKGAHLTGLAEESERFAAALRHTGRALSAGGGT